MCELKIDFLKYSNGLVPAIVQDAITNKVLMLGFMNNAAYEQTIVLKKVTFFSRSRNRLWIKGEESGNFLDVQSVTVDCDNDTLLIKAHPAGTVCHTGAATCWNEENVSNHFLNELESIITNRKINPIEGSYTTDLLKKGINKIAQKVGEEAIELVIEAKDNNKELFIGEAADLLFHYLVLLQAKEYSLQDVLNELKKRYKK
jgi:phosphoribosyl-AMP cyclohydrolase / phosphoribosyl-ATP pyrophosphohydrolase